MRKKKLLFICLGNICRSPAAEGVMKYLLKETGKADLYEIDSAGIGGWHAGQLPDARMRRCGAHRGYRFDSRARQLEQTDFDHFDHLIVMDEENHRAVLRLARHAQDRAKVLLMADYLQKYKGEPCVPDPYYGDDSDFEWALDLIEDSCKGLISQLEGSN
jgi:protein-tyrosine phosphatase